MIKRCVCCGSDNIAFSAVLWQALIDEWNLSPEEVEYINRQQGERCSDCGSNLRTMALAMAVMQVFRYQGFFENFVRRWQSRRLKILEINAAGNLSKFLSHLPKHVLKSYPEIDIQNLAFQNSIFDLVIHSDTLEHVPDPIKALSECRRVLKPGGICCFTVPVIKDRLTIQRKESSPSYHGSAEIQIPDYRVHTEYGADVWTHIALAGFQECRIVFLEFPAAQAFIGVNVR